MTVMTIEDILVENLLKICASKPPVGPWRIEGIPHHWTTNPCQVGTNLMRATCWPSDTGYSFCRDDGWKCWGKKHWKTVDFSTSVMKTTWQADDRSWLMWLMWLINHGWCQLRVVDCPHLNIHEYPWFIDLSCLDMAWSNVPLVGAVFGLTRLHFQKQFAKSLQHTKNWWFSWRFSEFPRGFRRSKLKSCGWPRLLTASPIARTVETSCHRVGAPGPWHLEWAKGPGSLVNISVNIGSHETTDSNSHQLILSYYRLWNIPCDI